MSDQILSIIETGSLEHSRFLITDPQERMWTGDGWSDKESEGRLYVSVSDANHAIQEIMRSQYAGKRLRRYVAPVYLDLYSENELSREEITDWLVKVSRLTIDPEKHGNGPVIGSLGLTRIEWDKLREIKAEDAPV